MLDIVIAMIFIYALFASLVSGVNEIIVQLLAMRGRVLFEGIAMMLGELPKDTGLRITRWYRKAKQKLGYGEIQNAKLTGELYLHPLIDTLSPPGSSRPSYISPQTFSAALVQVLSVDGSIESLKKSLEDRSKPLNRLLGPMLDEAGNNLQTFKTNVENHYNAVMDRVGGWYKRRTQVIMFFVGLILAMCLNVDSIYIVQQLQKNPEQVHALVEAAAEYSENQHKTDEVVEEKEKLVQKIKELNVKVDDFKTIGLPIGWNITAEKATERLLNQPDGKGFNIFDYLLPGQSNLFFVVIGWLSTALAGALGAPFWFDAISKIFAARGSGKKPG